MSGHPGTQTARAERDSRRIRTRQAWGPYLRWELLRLWERGEIQLDEQLLRYVGRVMMQCGRPAGPNPPGFSPGTVPAGRSPSSSGLG